MLGENQIAGTETDLVLTLLEADPELGCSSDMARSVRHALSVRRAIVEQRLRPSLRLHQVLVDYDDAAHQRINHEEHDHVHDLVRSATFTVQRTGQHLVTVAEIFTGYSMSVACQRRLMALLRLRPTFLAEARTMLNSVLQHVDYPVMAHCGQIRVAETDEVIASLHQIERRRLLTAIRPSDRWSQDYRLLAVAEV